MQKNTFNFAQMEITKIPMLPYELTWISNFQKINPKAIEKVPLTFVTQTYIQTL